MGTNQEQITIRLSTKMLSDIDAYIAAHATGEDKDEAIQHFVDMFLQAPKFFPADYHKDLRMPVEEISNITLYKESAAKMRDFAQAHEVSLSASMRLAIFLGLRGG